MGAGSGPAPDARLLSPIDMPSGENSRIRSVRLFSVPSELRRGKPIDRSPGGTGTSTRMAQRTAKGRLTVGDEFRHESLIGTIFAGRVEAEATIGGYRGILPSVGGWARIIGHNTIFVDDEDPLAHGFQLA